MLSRRPDLALVSVYLNALASGAGDNVMKKLSWGGTSVLVFQLLLIGSLSAGEGSSKPDKFERNGLGVHSSARFLKATPASDFNVARPETFADLEAFQYSGMEFQDPRPPAAVFATYVKTNPLNIWNNPRSRIYAIYVPSTQKTYTEEDIARNWEGFEEGMKLFIDMSSLPVAISNHPAMMVALEIVEIDPVSRRVVFAYLQGAPSYGFQSIRFEGADDSEGTVIVHETWFRSYKKIVEFLYPYFHRKMLNKMHRRLKRSSKSDTESILR